jgi:hypothetical protein
MKNTFRVFAMLIIAFLFSAVNLNAQSNDRNNPTPADKAQMERNQPRETGPANSDKPAGIMPSFSNYCLLKAIEKTPMKYSISVDFGNDKEGKPKEIFRGEKEKEVFDMAMKNGSIVDLINLLSVRGYEVKNAYVAMDGPIPVHYFLMANEKGAAQQMNQRPSADKPQLTPEQKEKMREEREKRRKEMETKK